VEWLGSRDLRNLLTALDRLDSDCDLAGFPERAIASVAAIVEFDLASYNVVDALHGRNRFLLVPDIAAARPGSLEYDAFHHFIDQHPLIRHYRSSSDLTPRKISDFMTDRAFRSLGLYADFYRAVDTNYQIALMIHRTTDLQIAVTLNRRNRDFDERDRVRLAALQPRIARHYLVALRLAQHAMECGQGSDRPDAVPRLTRRESEVLSWVALGKTNQEVAAIVGARPLTIKKHLEHIYHKLGVANRTAAVRLGETNRRPLIPNLR
jgi:DNA-binding CsgD family transcriptional regulator